MGEAEQLAKLRPWDNIVCITIGQRGILNMRLCRLTRSIVLTPSSSCACCIPESRKKQYAFSLHGQILDKIFQIHLSGGTYVDLRVWGMRGATWLQTFQLSDKQTIRGHYGHVEKHSRPCRHDGNMRTQSQRSLQDPDGGCRIDR